MESRELYHHGVKGMRWGVRRSSAQLGNSDGRRRLFQKKQKQITTKPKETPKPHKKSISEMSNEEIQARIDRIKLEKSLRELSTPKGEAKKSRGKDFVTKILEKSGENIATQASAYVMGVAVNKLAGKEIVDPKNIQKKK